MKQIPSRRGGLVVWFLSLALGLLLLFGPATIVQRVEAITLEGASWGLAQIHQFVDGDQESEQTIVSEENLRDDQNTQTEAQNRQLVAMVAQLRHQLDEMKQTPSPPSVAQNGSPLIQAKRLTGRVLGARLDGANSLQYLTELGQSAGISGEEIVLSGDGVLIDRGLENGANVDDVTTSGNALFGRIQQVGRWTSCIQPVTHPDFRIAVRVIRQSNLGPVWGPRGILHGQTKSLSVTDIPATEAIAVGDAVYAQATVETDSEYLYCGRILQAELAPGASHWTIAVQPAVDVHETVPKTLHVLAKELMIEN